MYVVSDFKYTVKLMRIDATGVSFEIHAKEATKFVFLSV